MHTAPPKVTVVAKPDNGMPAGYEAWAAKNLQDSLKVTHKSPPKVITPPPKIYIAPPVIHYAPPKPKPVVKPAITYAEWEA